MQTEFKDSNSIGTAFCIGSRLFLTAFHNICDNEGQMDFIGICLLDRTEAGNSRKEGRRVSCELVWYSNESDIALLRTIDELECPILYLRPAKNASDIQCFSRGFPRGGMIGNEREPLPISGILHPGAQNDTVLSFELNQGAPRLKDWAGISGAPIINASTTEVVGLILSARSAMGDSRYLEAMPSQNVIAHSEVCKAANTQQPSISLVAKSRLCSQISVGKKFSYLRSKHGHENWYMAERAKLIRCGLINEESGENLTETCYQLIAACAELRLFSWIN